MMKKTIIYTCMAMILSIHAHGQAFVANEKEDITDRLAGLFTEWYVDEGLANEMADMLRKNQRQGKYNQKDRKDFVEQLVADLREISKDKHVQMRFIPKRTESGEEVKIERPAFGSTGISRVAVLPGKVGRIRFDLFAPTPKAREEVKAAFARFRKEKVTSIVVDLRNCAGGNGDMTGWVMSHFLPAEPVKLSRIINRKMNIQKDVWSLGADRIPAEERFEQTLYVLTSSETFSGGESFAYQLKHLKRATIIGETTGGGANMVTRMEMVVVDDNDNDVGSYEVLMPFIKGINAITGTNWEGTGVVPDIKVKADDAWETAYELATASYIGNK